MIQQTACFPSPHSSNSNVPSYEIKTPFKLVCYSYFLETFSEMPNLFYIWLSWWDLHTTAYIQLTAILWMVTEFTLLSELLLYIMHIMYIILYIITKTIQGVMIIPRNNLQLFTVSMVPYMSNASWLTSPI